MSGTTISGTTVVSSGQTVSGATVTSGGKLEVASGGTVSAITVSSGGIEGVLPGGVADGGVVLSGGIGLFEGTVSGLTVSGIGIVASGAQMTGTTIASGGEIADGYKIGLTTYTGGAMSVTNIDGGTLLVSSGGVVTSNNVTSGGALTVTSGGVASASIVDTGQLELTGGGRAVGVTLNVSGHENVLSGGAASGTTVNNGGAQSITSGGSASGNVVNSGGVQLVLSGGTATGNTINAGGTQLVGYVGGSVNSAGGTAITTLLDGGSQTVFHGGVASATTAENGGIEYVSSGGTATGTTLGVNGGMVIEAGATITGPIDFTGAGATLVLQGVTTLSNVISGFDAAGVGEDDAILLAGAAGAGAGTATLGTNNVLSVTDGSVSYQVQLDPAQSFAGDTFVVSAGLVTAQAVCFAAGTRILTETGPVAVEDLAVGDRVIAHGGRCAPIQWIGRRTLDARRHPRPELIWPVRIEAGAITDGVPARDLYVSPDHALYLDGLLVPAKALVNGTTIAQVERRHVDYFHLELDRHDVVFAEGLPTETYLETGNRGFFSGEAGQARVLHPDFAQTLREREGYAPFAEAGAAVTALRRKIVARAGAVETTGDPGIVATIGARTVAVTRVGAACWRVAVPTSGDVRLTSRTLVPAHLDAGSEDRRVLGLDVAALETEAGRIDLGDARLTAGWHRAEDGHRWTRGDAVIPAALLKGARSLTIRLASAPLYPVVRERRRVTARR
ncbi:Hint domain-containing protein [Acidiphilium sp. AL]|uniref:Hint domain-containing protein n=1 Tax=Acidiphilium sp. AL TaxID=2871704 RepID=UPI0021CB561A|nr:Hint domain-containing protein [Acidiphilium sp. AL]MCU4159877.1 Hint domain-containing protein [Acidiphilium sp. AL]